MKSTIIVLVAIVAIALAQYPTDYEYPSQPSQGSTVACRTCSTTDYSPICASNGRCSRWFNSICYMEQYNCLYGNYYGQRYTKCDNSFCQGCCTV